MTPPPHDASVHVEPVRNYIAIFLALLVLTAVTVGVAEVDLGRYNTLVAMAIAIIKATLVVLFFMHVRHGTRLTKLVLVSALLWLLLLLVLTMGDYVTRGW